MNVHVINDYHNDMFIIYEYYYFSSLFASFMQIFMWH